MDKLENSEKSYQWPSDTKKQETLASLVNSFLYKPPLSNTTPGNIRGTLKYSRPEINGLVLSVNISHLYQYYMELP